MNAKQEFLEAFVIDNSSLEELEALIAEFNIFEAMGAVRQELRHSDFLAFLLNPSEKHGLGDAFLKRFLMRVLSISEVPPVSPIMIDVKDLSNAVVERESQNIDILIYDAHSGLVCVVENKISTDEHTDQLNRYLQLVRQRFPKNKAIIPVFLTPDGVSPEDDDSPYIPVSYGQVSEIMEQVREAHESIIGADVNTMIEHYIAMLRRYVVSESDIAKLCRQIYRTHKEAIDLIIVHMPDLRQEIAEYLANLVKNTPTFSEVRFTKTYIDFTLRSWEQTPEFNTGTYWSGSSATVIFQFYNGPNRLDLYLVICPVAPDDEYIRETVFAYADTNRNVFRGCRPKLTPKWTMLYKMPLLHQKDYEDASFEDLKQTIEQKWSPFIQNILPQLDEHLMRIEFPPNKPVTDDGLAGAG